MDYVRQLPLLRMLSAVELAKLLPDLREESMQVGDRLEPAEVRRSVIFVEHGQLEVHSRDENQDAALSRVPPAGIFWEMGIPGHRESNTFYLEALEPTRVIMLPAPIFEGLIQERPPLLAAFNQTVMHECAARLESLAHLRLRGESVGTACAQEEPQPAAREPVILSRLLRRREASAQQRLKLPTGLLSLGLVTLGSLALAFWPGLPLGEGQTRYLLAALTWGALCWLFNAMPEHVVALATCLVVGAAGLAPAKEAFSGFANTTWFLLLGVWCIGVSVSQTGLLYRVALHILRILPATYAGQALALSITGVLSSPLLPSSQGRIVIAAPLTMELGEAMRLAPNSKGSAGLAMASFMGFGNLYFLFLNGTTTTILAWSLLPVQIREQANWLYWLVAALPAGLVIFLLTHWAIMRSFPVETKVGLSATMIRAQLKLLGPMSRGERIGLAVISAVLLGFMTAQITGMDPAWFCVAGMLVLMASNVLTKESLSREVNWAFILFFGAVSSIAHVARGAQLDVALSGLLKPLLTPVMAYPLLAVLVVSLVTFLLRMAMSSIQVMPLLTIILSPLFLDAGYNPFGVMLTIVTISTTFAVGSLSPVYMAMLAGTRERMFSTRQVRSFALVHSAILLVGVLLSVPYWLWLKAL